MLKQLSISQKIFGVATLLLAFCYVGILFQTQGALADIKPKPNWHYYRSTVNNITEFANDNFQVGTNHEVRYTNTHNHTVNNTIRGKAQWRQVGGTLTTNDPSSWDTTVFCFNNTTATHLTFRTHIRNLARNEMWEASAYTNLIVPDQWDNGAPFGQIERPTATFDPDAFNPGVTPPTPVSRRRNADGTINDF